MVYRSLPTDADTESAEFLTYKNCTTASVMFDIADDILIGQVATKASSRGSGYAREFLPVDGWLFE